MDLQESAEGTAGEGRAQARRVEVIGQGGRIQVHEGLRQARR